MLTTTVRSLAAPLPHVVAAIFLVAMMVQLGLELAPVHDVSPPRHARLRILRALVLNFALVPLLALLTARWLGATGPVAIALLLLAASPGGRHAPALARAGGGDVGLAVEITLWSNKLNALLTPLWAAWMLDVHRVHLRDATYILELLLLQLLPYFAARTLGRYRPDLGVRIGHIAGRIATGAALGLLVFLLAHRALRTTLLLGPRGWLAVLLFGAVLLLLGWLFGGRSAAARRSFAITSEARNLALALVVASRTLHDETVELALFAAWLVLLGFAVVASLGARRVYRRSAPSPAPQHAGAAPG